MKFVCSQSDLNANLSLVSRAVPSRPTHPVLGNVLIRADAQKGQVSLTGFDLSLGISTRFEANVDEGGEITLPAKLTGDIVARLPEGEITVQSEEGERANLVSASGRFSVRGIEASEFPSLPVVEEGKELKLPIAVLSEGLRGTLFAASSEETKQILTGVHLRRSLDNLEFAATDGHRLAVVKTELAAGEDFALTIPARALRELERMLGSDQATESVNLQFDESQAIFTLGNFRLTSRKLEGTYPAYQELIPQQFKRTMTVERKRLLSSLERVAVLADQKNNIARFDLDNSTNQLVLSVEARDIGSAKEEMPAQITGESGEIAFNIKYLMDGLKVLPASDLQMQLNEGNQPVIFTPLGEIKMTYLVMPVQIRD